MIQLPLPLILASGSPRRKELLSILNLPFKVVVSDSDESFEPTLPPIEVPGILAERKALTVQKIQPQSVIIAADTVVDLEGKILNKPLHLPEAREMLHSLSGKMHYVHKAYSIVTPTSVLTRTDTAKVHFKSLTSYEIDWYLKEGKPLDKAGAYGIQEWIGLIAVDKLEGSYFTVMGLPTHLLWQDLVDLAQKEPGSH